MNEHPELYYYFSVLGLNFKISKISAKFFGVFCIIASLMVTAYLLLN